jgi:hypothetical protein
MVTGEVGRNAELDTPQALTINFVWDAPSPHFGRNALRGPSLKNFEFSVLKNHNLLREKLNAQFRAEFFNIFNHTSFRSGNLQPFNGRGALVAAHTALKAPTSNTSRKIQFGIKLTW